MSAKIYVPFSNKLFFASANFAKNNIEIPPLYTESIYGL